MASFDGLSLRDLGMPLWGLRRAAFNSLNEKIYNKLYTLKETEACFCGGCELERLSRFDRFGLPFGTLICRSCGLITIDKVLSDDDIPTFYNELYWPLITGARTPLFETTQEDYGDFLAYLAPFVPDARVIMEIGCGSGHRLGQVRSTSAASRCKYIGCDYSEKALELAARRGVEVIHGGARELSSRGKADILILSHVFEHFVDLDNALRDIGELIHRDSIVYIEVPGVIDLENKREYGYDYQDYCVLAHIHNFSLATLTAVVGKTALKLVKGNEYVRAIFSMTAKATHRIAGNPYEDIMSALERARARAKAHRSRPWRCIQTALAAVRGAL